MEGNPHYKMRSSFFLKFQKVLSFHNFLKFFLFDKMKRSFLLRTRARENPPEEKCFGLAPPRLPSVSNFF